MQCGSPSSTWPSLPKIPLFSFQQFIGNTLRQGWGMKTPGGGPALRSTQGLRAPRGECQRGLGTLNPLQSPAKPRTPGLKPQPVPAGARARSHTHTHVPQAQMWDHKTLWIPAGDKTQGSFCSIPGEPAPNVNAVPSAGDATWLSHHRLCHLHRASPSLFPPSALQIHQLSKFPPSPSLLVCSFPLKRCGRGSKRFANAGSGPWIFDSCLV